MFISCILILLSVIFISLLFEFLPSFFFCLFSMLVCISSLHCYIYVEIFHIFPVLSFCS
ncbi:hypothetical protein E2C01_052647 [Portunus trituberculatus]|uniref:Uncharacterized protein n=1 Tax=Portunus trituberculatus TaxID=210409 RepID=A0A5B7GE98_PORTR|nr:hypothetical protein [Portunus trituberculatus]